MIRVVDLVQHYGVRPVLRNVNLEVKKGELMALMGPNGMGKSTLLAAMAGVLSPQRGYVEIEGLRRRSTPENELAIRRKVVYLPDHPWMPTAMTGREYLLAIGKLYEIDETHLIDHVQRLLDLFDLEGHGDSPIRAYSNGQQKKIAIAGALVTERPIMLLDEPFSGGLDPAALVALRRVMTRLAEREDITVVMATPVPEIVEGLAHRVAIIREGEIIAVETPEALRARTESANLTEALEKLMNPETLAKIDSYLEGLK